MAWPAAVRLQLEIGTAGPIPRAAVAVDPARFQQVMSNLLSNACKFSHPGARVEVAGLLRGDRVRIEVRDRGPGIPADFRERIFQKFSQADASTARSGAGTGLGLAISKGLVEAMGGTIGFEPREGGGTVFLVELPALPAGDGAPGDPERRTEPLRAAAESEARSPLSSGSRAGSCPASRGPSRR